MSLEKVELTFWLRPIVSVSLRECHAEDSSALACENVMRKIVPHRRASYAAGRQGRHGAR